MADLRKVEFFLLRYVPDAVKDEFVNIGLVMVEPGSNSSGFAEVRFTQDWRRVLCLDPQADIEMLEALEREVRRLVLDASGREWLLKTLQDSFSNLIQVSPMKACLAEEPVKEVEMLAKLYFEGPKVSRPRVASGRENILRSMRAAFEQSGVWTLLMHGVPVSPYTRPGDPFKFDFGYRVENSMKLFHAVSMKAGVEQAAILAARYPKIFPEILKVTQSQPFLTAIVDDDLDRSQAEVQIGLEMMQDATITVAAARQMPEIAEMARVELKV